MKSRIGKALLHLAAVLFVLNTATAYGSCCFMPADAESETQMPCHTSNGEAVEVPADDCCPMCVPIPQPLARPYSILDGHQAKPVADIAPPTSSGFDPPYRPPIQLLS